MGILIFKGLTAQHLYKSFGVKGLMYPLYDVTSNISVVHSNSEFSCTCRVFRISVTVKVKFLCTLDDL
jgi:hypothetical protein